MKKYVLMILTLVTAFVTGAQGSPVDRTIALQQARQFLQAKGMQPSDKMMMVHSSQVMKENKETVPAYFVFNNGDNGGYVIVSGDSDGGILGYSDSGSFDAGNVPVQLMDLLDGYSMQVSRLDVQQDAVQDDPVPGRYKVNAVRAAIAPLLTCKWSQDSPYNGSCPIYNSSTGDRCMAGCVPTALAQLLYYYKDRNVKETTTAIPSYKKGSFTVSEIPAGTKLDWDNMLNTYSGLESTVSKKAVSDLIFYSGAALQATYTSSSTSSSVTKAVSSLVNYFGFHPAARLARRLDYTKSDWNDLIYNELANNRPVLYSGSSVSNVHAFIIDGFDGDQFYHVNWGWGGTCEGYFLLSSLDHTTPESLIGGTANSYNQFQYAVVNAQPINGAAWEDLIPSLTSEIVSYNTSTGVLYSKFYNYNQDSDYFCYGYGVVSEDGTATPIGSPKLNIQIGVGGYTTLSYSLKASDLSALGLSSGTHTLKVAPIYRRANDNQWYQCQSKRDAYLEVSYKQASTPSIQKVVVHPVLSLKCTNIQLTGSCIANTEQPVLVTIENTGDDFADEIYLFANKSKAFTTYKSSTGLYLAPGEKTIVEMRCTPTSSGTWYFAVSDDYTGASYFGITSQDIYTGTSTKSLAIDSYSINSLGGVVNGYNQIYGSAITGKVRIKNTGSSPYSGTIAICIRQKATSQSQEVTGSFDRYTLNLKPNETVDFNIDFRGLDYNMFWYKVVYYYSGTSTAISGNPWKLYQLVPGVMAYDKDGNLVGMSYESTYSAPDGVTAIDMTGLVGPNGITSVVPNSNPNTLYIIGQDDTTPAGLAGMNIVKGNSSDMITFNDNYDFYSPLTVTADKVEYNRVPTIAATGTGGWTTIALPFTVSSVTTSGQEIDWFRSDEESGKRFWLKEFIGENNGVVKFDYAQEMVANTPYIIAVAGPEWGDNWNLLGRKMTFTGDNQTLAAGSKIITGSDKYNFIGSTIKVSDSDIWTLNEAGSAFKHGTYDVQPFHAYFKAKQTLAYSPDVLFMDEASAIMVPVACEGENVAVYDLNGIKVAEAQVTNGQANLDQLPKGVYVIKGHKFVKY